MNVTDLVKHSSMVLYKVIAVKHSTMVL